MPRVPLLQSHTKSVDILIQLLDKSNGLNNWLVLPVHIGGALVSGETMTETQLGSRHISIIDFLHNLDEMGSASSVQLSNGVVECCGETGLG
jgi:hypothetical protein